MIWILAIVVVGLIAVLAEMFLSYQKRASDLRLAQDPLRRRIQAHSQAMQEAVSGIQGAAAGQVAQLTADLTSLAQRAEDLRGNLGRLEREVFGEGHNAKGGGAGTQDDLIEGDGTEAGRVDPKVTPEAKLKEAREFLRQEVDGHRLSLQRDVEVVRRTLALLDTKLRRGPSPAGKAKK